MRPYEEVADEVNALVQQYGGQLLFVGFLSGSDVQRRSPVRALGRRPGHRRRPLTWTPTGPSSPSSGSDRAVVSTSPSRRSTPSPASRTATCARPATRAPTSFPTRSTFDALYETADRFDEVYAAIVEAVVAAAGEHGEVLYAVPGSPLVLERTVRALLADERVRCEVLPAMSFLDLVWARLGIDPVESAVRLIDGHEFAVAAAGTTGAMLIAHTHADWVLSDIKLAAEEATGDEQVVILQGLGTPEERITRTTWSELDRAVEPDHLTCVYVPALGVPSAPGTSGSTSSPARCASSARGTASRPTPRSCRTSSRRRSRSSTRWRRSTPTTRPPTRR